MRSFTKAFLMLLLCTLSALTTQAKTEKVHATFENPSNTNTSWNAETKTFTWSTTYYNQLRNIGLPNGDVTKYKKLVVDCTIKSGDQFRILIYKGGSNLTLYAKNGVNEFILADTLKALYPNDYNEYLLACDEICLSGNNAAAPGEAVINDMYLETYDDEGEKVYATFENPSNTNTSWNAETKTFTWSTTYYNQLRNIGLPSGDITKYKKLVVDCEIKSGDQFRVLIYKGGSNLTLYAKNGVNEFILADTLKALYPNDYNEYLLACDEICLSGNNAAAPGEAVINAVYLETYPENESVEIPEIQYEEDPGKPEGNFVDFIEVFSTLQPRIGLGEDTHPIVLGNGDVVVGQRTKDVIADLSAYSKLTMVTSPNLKLVVYMNHEVDAQQNAGDYAPADSGKYVFLNVQADENGIAEIDLTQYTKQNLNCICLPWDNNNKGTVWYLLLTKKADTPAAAEDVLPIDIQFGADYNDKGVQNYTSTWTATKDGKTWIIVNFNNNNNGWNFIKCGSKNNASVASITSPAINAEVKAYTISLTAAANVNSAKLTMMNGEEKVGEDIDITESFVAGEVVVPVEGQKGYSYVLTINNAQGSGNGSVQISKITLSGEVKEPVHIANTAETAYTVAKAIELIDAGEALSDTVFVKGIVSQVDSYSDEYKNITYWISEDGKTEGAQFECFRGKGIDGADFASINDVEVGAEVVVKGILQKYGETYELSQGNALVSYKAPFKPLFADGKYYIYNVGTKKYLAAGANWGTHAVVNATGLDYEIKAADGKYTMDSQISNGGANNFLNGEWNDGAAFGWTIAKVSDGIFTISNGENFLTAGENGIVTLAADATVEAAHWTMKTLDERLAELAAATVEAPVDATFLIQDADFGRNDLRKSAWKMEASNQNLSGGEDGNGTVGNNNAESYHSTFTLSQTLSKAPAGKYKMTAQGYYRQDDNATEDIPVFYANDKTAEFPAKTGSENSMTDAAKSFSAGQYTIEPIEFTVFEDGLLTIGAKGTATHQWVIFDNFRLTYLSSEIPADEFKPAYENALAAAQAALADEAYAAVTGEEKTALQQAIDDNKEIAEPTSDLYKAAISALNTATSNFTGAKAAYDALAAAKTAKGEFDFTPYPYASATKIAAAQATLTFEATSAADATAKTDSIVCAFRKAVESNAMLEGLEGAINYSDSIAGANAEVKTGWTGSIGTNTNEGYTDGEGVTSKLYLDGGWSSSAGANIDITREVKVPAGKYILTATARGAVDLTEYTMSIGGQTVNLPHIGAGVADGVFGRGWSDAFVEFESTGEPLTLQIIAKSEATQQWMSINRFRLVKFPAPVEVAHTWDFTKWSEATVANLKAEAAKGYTDGLWSDAEKADGSASTMEISKDNCFWQVGTSAAEGEELTANGQPIAELQGLLFKNNKARSLAIAVNYGDCTPANGEGFGPYNGPAYLWLGSKTVEYFTIKNVKAGTEIKMGVESHKITDARGVQLLINGTAIEGPDAPKEYTEQTWQIPGEGLVDVVVKNTNGCHLYFIDAEIGEPAPVDSALIAAIDALKAIIAADKTIQTEGQQGADAFATAIATAEGAANAADATVESIAAARAALASAVATFTKANLGGEFVEIEQTQSPEISDGASRATVVEGDGYTQYTTDGGVCVIIKKYDVDVKDCDYVTIKFAEPLPNGINAAFWAQSGTANVGMPAGAYEYKYVFADDDNCAIANDVLPQLTLLTLWNSQTVNIVGVYKHYTEEYMTSINTVKTNNLNGVIFNLNGQKVNKAQKGMYIINGKKVVIK